MTLHETLKRLIDTARRFEMKTPKYRRLESERQALQEAITDAQLVLSVHEVSTGKSKSAGRALRSMPSRTSRK